MGNKEVYEIAPLDLKEIKRKLNLSNNAQLLQYALTLDWTSRGGA